MKLMISGHRLQKLSAYDKEWIQIAIEEGIRVCNCFQMLIEKKKDIYWINPLTKTINYINNTKEEGF
jgi:hypothetical protein